MQGATSATKPIRFVIVGTQRTGTTLIRTSLSSHPEILCHGEVFSPGYHDPGGYHHYTHRDAWTRVSSTLRPAATVTAFLRDLYAETGPAAVGFKLMLNQCERRPVVWEFLSRQHTRVILVERRNVIKTLVSRRTAAASGVYHVSESMRRGSSVRSWKPRKIRLDTATLLPELDAIAAEPARWKARLGSDADVLHVVYEDYLDDQDAGNGEILSFLDVRPTALTTDLKKVNPDRLQDIVENYRELVEVVENSRYAEYLT